MKLHLVQRLRMHGAIPHSPYFFIIWCQIKHRYNFTTTLIHKCTKTCTLQELWAWIQEKMHWFGTLNTFYVGLIWLRIEPSGRLLWRWWWTLRFTKMWGSSWLSVEWSAFPQWLYCVEFWRSNAKHCTINSFILSRLVTAQPWPLWKFKLLHISTKRNL